MSDYIFDNAEHALKWAVEVLRRRRMPKLTSLWREIEAEAEWVGQAWEGPKSMTLPTDRDERMHLALKVMEATTRCGEGAAKLLGLWAMGDWADEGRLTAAMAIQERCRREGLRVRLAYRYTYDQLGAMLGCDRKAAWRRVQEALALLGRELGREGYVVVVDGAEAVTNGFKKSVYFDEFKYNN